MRVIFIRHGKTSGNLEKRYVGRTDESLSEVGKKELCEKVLEGRYPSIDGLIISPMKRCLETASILYHDRILKGDYIAEEGLREMDFGLFEYKNFEELDGDPEYQKYLDSGGYRNFPEGETLQAFEERCVKGFSDAMQHVLEKKETAGTIGVVAHGGTIMALMNRLCTTKKSYYDWMLDNGAFYICDWDGEALCLQDI